ncbi:PDZ and LIM domain protein 1-like [Diadema antillarum]|uniref:PDZ and LIM domain protein 1-like n=1 Tax=Diadema antillarum TaxID=105358 RepID=UPI003A83E24C
MSALGPGPRLDDEEDKIERPVITDQDVSDAGDALQANPFTISESFNKLEEGNAPHIFSGAAKGSESVFKREGPIVDNAPNPLKNATPGHCVACGVKLKGKFSKIRDHGFHFDCFNCAGCGKNLRGIGYFEVKGYFYCRKCKPL